MKNILLKIYLALSTLIVGISGSKLHASDEAQVVSCYVDMGKLYGNYVVGQCIDWWPEPATINKYKLDAFLSPFFDKLINSGIDRIYLAFSQIGDIESLLNETSGSATDTITPIFKDNYKVATTDQNFLHYFIEQAHNNQLKVYLSFGGAIAAGNDMKIPGDGKEESEHLTQFVENYQLDGLDFDLEGTGGADLISQNNPDNLEEFFQSLHSSMQSMNKSIVITVAGSINDGPNGTLKPLFDQYQEFFDGCNLMLYSNSQYYIDADNETWGLKQWCEYVPHEQIHIGFYDAIDYTNPQSSAGTQYAIPSGLSNGEAAGFVFQKAQDNLETINPNDMPLSSSFIWTDDPVNIPNNSFFSDFYQYIKSH